MFEVSDTQSCYAAMCQAKLCYAMQYYAVLYDIELNIAVQYSALCSVSRIVTVQVLHFGILRHAPL